MKGVVFDFDGPIFPGRKAAVAALNATHDQFAEAVGRPRQSMATAPLYPPSCMIDAAYAEFDLPRDRLSEIRAYYTEQVRLAERALAVEAAVVRLLDGLLARGCRLAVLTSRDKTNVTELLKHLGLSNRFRLVVGSDGDPTRKLDPAMFPTIAEQLGLDVADLVLVGDSDTDCKAAQIAGVPYYHVAWSGEPTSEAHVRATAVANSVGDLEAIFSDNKPLETYLPTVLPSQLVEAIQAEAVSFFAGAGASVPSGIGGWADHYLPLLRKLGAGSLLGEAYPLPEILQLLCASPQDESRIFDGFRDSFRMMSGKRANAYHYAMLKSHTRTIWTTNYDLLFEQAVLGHSFEHIVVKTDDELLNNFSARSLIIKLNGDFEGAKFRPDLEWDMVFVEEQFDTAEVSRREIWRLFEDHYRNKLIVFVGVSFRDPALRRILSVAAKAIPRSRYQHLLLMKVPDNPLERTPHRLYAEALKRRNIQTLFFNDFAAIERFVCRIGAQAIRPIVGFSGTATLDPAAPLTGPTGAAIDPKGVEEWCKIAGRALAALNFRVTSGHGEGVGVPAVTAAFEQNPTSARFYLRMRGTTKFSRLAPAIVVGSDTLEDMRERFVSELDLLIAVGGQKTQEATSGTVVEIKLALDKQVPVLIIPQAGGDASGFAPELASHARNAFVDASMADAICEANAKIASVPAEDLTGFMENDLPILAGDLVAQMMGAATKRARDYIDRGPGSDW